MSTLTVALPRLRLRRWRPRRDRLWAIAYIAGTLAWIGYAAAKMLHGELTQAIGAAIWVLNYLNARRVAAPVFRSDTELPIPFRWWAVTVMLWVLLAIQLAAFPI